MEAEGRCQNTLEQAAPTPTAHVGSELVTLPGVDLNFAHNLHAPCDPKEELFGYKKTNK